VNVFSVSRLDLRLRRAVGDAVHEVADVRRPRADEPVVRREQDAARVGPQRDVRDVRAIEDRPLDL
jgi:hypothetical protein